MRLLQIADITLLQENLKIKIVGDYTEITVEYHLKNNGPSQKVAYGFPVDAFETDWWFGDPLKVFSRGNDCLKYFNAYENEQPLKVSQWIVDNLYSASTYGIEYLSERRKQKKYKVHRKWSSLNLFFKSKETKKLTIKYKIKNTLRDKKLGFKEIPEFTERHFTYDLNPSKNWDNGIVKKMNVSIDISDIGNQGAQYEVTGLKDYEVINHRFTHSSSNFDLKQAGRIEIQYNTIPIKLSKFIKKKKLSDSHITNIKCSTNEEWVCNLIDGDVKTTWEGTEGDCIEFSFEGENGKSILGLMMLSGDYSSKENFVKSNKIKKLKILTNDVRYHSTEPWIGKGGNKTISLENPQYLNLSTEHMPGFSVVMADGIFPKQCKKLRIEILEGEGSISEIYILERRYDKPQFDKKLKASN